MKAPPKQQSLERGKLNPVSALDLAILQKAQGVVDEGHATVDLIAEMRRAVQSQPGSEPDTFGWRHGHKPQCGAGILHLHSAAMHIAG